LTGKEILICLRKKIPADEFFSSRTNRGSASSFFDSKAKEKISESFDKQKIKEIADSVKGTNKAVFLNENLEEIKSVSAKDSAGTLRRLRGKPMAIVIDGTATNILISSAEEAGVKVIVAKNFTTTDTKIELMSF